MTHAEVAVGQIAPAISEGGPLHDPSVVRPIRRTDLRMDVPKIHRYGASPPSYLFLLMSYFSEAFTMAWAGHQNSSETQMPQSVQIPGSMLTG